MTHLRPILDLPALAHTLGQPDRPRCSLLSRPDILPASAFVARARTLASLGLKIVAVWEQNSPDPENLSYSSGYSDAFSAYKQAKAIGQPAGSAIYFAIDFNAHELEPAKEYFRGITAGLTVASGGRAEYKVGVYGSGAVCDAIKRAGLARYSWLTKATSWDGSLDYNDWNIKQGEALPFSFDNDSDEVRGDYGGFRLREL